MKVAKPTPRDIEASDELHRILDSIDARFGGPWSGPEYPESLNEAMAGDAFDSSNIQHLGALYNELARLLRTAPNFYGRVLMGMCHVILNPENKLMDPNLDYLELHPELRGLLNNLAPTP